LSKLMKKYDWAKVMHGLNLESAELYRGGMTDEHLTRERPEIPIKLRLLRGKLLTLSVGIAAAGGGTTVLRQRIPADEDLEILVRAALTSMSDTARQELISDIIRSELVDED